MNKRIHVIQLAFACWSLVIAARLGYWQVVKAAELKRQAQLQYSRSTTIPASRGSILYSDGFPMVMDMDSYMLYANPSLLVSQDLSELFKLLPASDSAKKLLSDQEISQLSWIALSHKLDLQSKQLIEKLHLPGVGFEIEPNRSYLEGSSSAYITGFVGKDDAGAVKGYFGLEGYYDRLLSGKDGRLVQERDAFNRPIVISRFNRIPPRPGNDLKTSINRALEYIAYTKLLNGIQKYQAESGTVSIMESKTGRILAMVSYPGYSPGTFNNFAPTLFANPIISEGYEPGSTFKVVVMASALDAGVVTPTTICDICGGPAYYSGEKVGSYNDKYYPESTMTDVILHSDNVGMTFVSRKLGKKRLLSYIRKFGFGQLTGIDLQEESSPPLRGDDSWLDIDLATASFGQGIAVTRLQMLAAVNTIANQGQYLAPKIVTDIISGSNSKPVNDPSPVKIISPQAAVKITEMMINGVQKGEVRYYKPDGYLIAGKTGTAQVAIAGHYDQDKVISSFVGFAPAQDPVFTMLVTLKDPKSSPWGSTTAAPLWFDIAQEILRYYRIPPNNN